MGSVDGMKSNEDQRRRVTNADVAKAAGVSTAAASYALSGAPGVSDELRERIVKIARELGFRPSKIAQDLRAGSSRSIGLLIDDIANPAYTEVARGAARAAGERGFEVFVSHLGTDEKRKAEVALSHVDRKTSGLIFTSVTPDDRALLETLAVEQVPYVQVYRRVEEPAADWVGVDDYTFAKATAVHVLGLGRRSVALIGGHRKSSAAIGRVRGWKEALAEAGLSVRNPRSVWGTLSREDGYRRASAIFGKTPDVDAILCGNDVTALGVMDYARENGIRIPEVLALTGFDNMSFSSAGPLQLTTVSVPRDLMGVQAAHALIDRVEGFSGPPRYQCLECSVVVRNSTVPAGVSADRGGDPVSLSESLLA